EKQYLPDENGSMDSPDADLDRVREKTFNKELSDLVEKIRAHELTDEQEVEEDIPEIAVSEISEDDLLRKYHDLFYRAVNMIGAGNTNTIFNQFELSLNSIKDDLERYIDLELRGMSYPHYSILLYSLEKKCYVIYVNHIDGLDENNIIIDPNEELHKNIYDNKKGVIIGSRVVNNNIYLKKRFLPDSRVVTNYSYYFLSFRNLTSDFFSGMERPTGRDLPYRAMFPILVVRLDNEEARAETVFSRIRDRLTVHFIFLARKLIIKTHNTRSGSHNDLYNIMEHNFKLFQRDSDGLCYVVKCSAGLTKEILFVLKYLHIKLKETLSKRTIISRIEKNKFVILITKPELNALKRVVDDFNRFYNNIFVMNEYKIASGNPMEIYFE
ncbi:MAG: hypothetical protein MUC95_09100, partial [Spirochaetes bacterium]|nr:hypothetical protein [Spirochaetota bacterium]